MKGHPLNRGGFTGAGMAGDLGRPGRSTLPNLPKGKIYVFMRICVIIEVIYHARF